MVHLAHAFAVDESNVSFDCRLHWWWIRYCSLAGTGVKTTVQNAKEVKLC